MHFTYRTLHISPSFTIFQKKYDTGRIRRPGSKGLIVNVSGCVQVTDI